MPRLLRRLLSAAVTLLVALALVSTGLVVSHHNAIVITHGVSMNPVYFQGDLVVVQRQSSYHVGEIVAYERPDLHLVVLHRIVAANESGFTFKGDNNQSIDPTTPSQAQLIGRAVLHVPQGGTWLHRLTAPPLLGAYAFLLLLGGSTASRTRRQRCKDLRAMPGRHRAKHCAKTRTLPTSFVAIASVTAALGLIAAVVSGLAWTRPASAAVTITGSSHVAMDFSYVARVAPSPAYDGTTVTAPQPVFLALAKQVVVGYHYVGLPGTLQTSVELSTSSGWQTTIPVGTATVGRTYDGTVRLDLAALQGRADRAGKVIGLPASEVTVAVVPRLSYTGGRSFDPRLGLTLTPSALRTTGDLTAQGKVTSRHSVVVPASLSLVGHTVAVTTVRAAGLVMVVLSLLVGCGLAVLARRSEPLGEAARVHHRYGDLILPVHPVALPPGRPVVDLPDVAALTRLAERYGLLVLHWCRGGVDTYVVQDEGTSYRYRTADVLAPSAQAPVRVDS